MKKRVQTPEYNYIFDTESGHFSRWGKKLSDDPQYSPIGAEILDMEISTVCHQGCQFCYKSNTCRGKNMSFETFKLIVDKMSTVTQIAFGIGDVDGNPDMFRMFEYCRSKGIVPNVTINGFRLTNEIASNLVKYCGAVAVSCYNSDVCYDAVKKLTDMGLQQVNIHQLVAEETFDSIMRLIHDAKHDERLSKLKAIVLLSLKTKGRGVGYRRLDDIKFKQIINRMFASNVAFGCDSCTAHKFLNACNPYMHWAVEQSVEPCESGCFSSYVDVDGFFHPCSFAEGMGYGIDVKTVDDFLQDVWYNPKTIAWRKNLIANGRTCPLYNI